MDGNDCDSAIRVSHDEMASLLPKLAKAHRPKGADDLAAREWPEASDQSDLDGLNLNKRWPRLRNRNRFEVDFDGFSHSAS